MKLNGKINGQFFKKKRKRRHCDQDSPLQDLEEEMQCQAIVNFTCLPTNLNSEDIMITGVTGYERAFDAFLKGQSENVQVKTEISEEVRNKNENESRGSNSENLIYPQDTTKHCTSEVSPGKSMVSENDFDLKPSPK